VPVDAGPLALPHGGVIQGRAATGIGAGYSLNLGSVDLLYDDVHPWDEVKWLQTVDLTNVDVITFRLRIKGAAAIARPSDLIALGHCDGHAGTYGGTIWDLDYAKNGGSLTGATVGSPSLAAGKFGPAFIFNAAEAITWSGADLVDTAIDTGTLSFWWRPDYTGAPGARQYLASISASSASAVNGVRVYHDAGPVLGWEVYDSSGVAITTATRSFSPTSGTWYHVEVPWNTTVATGWGSALFVDGSKQGADVAGTGTRTGTAQRLAAGRWLTTSNANVFGIDEIQVYDTVQHVADFDAPDGALPEGYWLFRAGVSGGIAYEDRIYPGADVEYATRSINVFTSTGSVPLNFKLIAI
jgi:hypothetical protein